jgi:tRNA/tmRNA/rRNA uracil-C5-methylase (TrmA/RlmC/RlmD family)
MPSSDEAQRAFKVARVRQALGSTWDREDVGWVATRAFGYRRRIRLRVARGRLAFFNEDKAASCAVLEPGLRATIDQLNGRLAGAMPAGVTHAEVRSPDLDGRPGLFLAGDNLDEEALGSHLPDVALAVAGGRGGPPSWQRWSVIDGVYAHVPVDAFLQIHAATNRALLEALVSGACRRGAATFVDAYAGAGNHALALAAAGSSGIAVDRHAGAIAALRHSAAEQGLRVESWVADAAEVPSSTPPDLLVANPPRAGLRDRVGALAAHGARLVALVVCTTEALARDVIALREQGYHLDEVTAFDMFPQTDHLETLAWLRRRP